VKLIYKGKFDGNYDNLPYREHKSNYVKFKESSNTTELAIKANIAAILLVIVLQLIASRQGNHINSWGIFLSLLTMFPHEFLHAICFKEEVYLYTLIKKGMLFVVGNEDMSKTRFITMSLLPNAVFGIIPYIVGMVIRNSILTSMGVFAISMGCGDYINVYNAITQMPKGARTYLHKYNSYWYIPS
jgi:Putative zincin peptidase